MANSRHGHAVEYFPTRLPDEILCSLIGRYHLETLSISIRNTKLELFGFADVNIPVHFPTNLTRLKKRVGHLLGLSNKEMISSLTLWDFFKPFIPIDKHRVIVESMFNQNAGTLSFLLGINGSAFELSKLPKYCPRCNQESIEKNNLLYWKRVHQIPFITLCTDHNCFLEDFKSPDPTPFKSPLYPPTSENCPVKIPRSNSENLLLKLSVFMREILERKRSLNFNYRDLAFTTGYTQGPFVQITILKKDVKEFYSPLRAIDFFAKAGLTEDFITSRLVNSSKGILNPLRHILLQFFFNEKMKMGNLLKVSTLQERKRFQGKHVKGKQIFKNQNSIKNLKGDDTEALRLLKIAYDTLISNNVPRRISKSTITRAAGFFKAVNLPKCEAFLNKAAESQSQYQKRRIDSVARSLKYQGITITVPRLLFDAHVWKRTKDVVAHAEKIKRRLEDS